MKIAFNQPLSLGNEIHFLQDAVNRQKFSAGGYYSDLCSNLLKKIFSGSHKVHMTSSCTAAMEMAALLCKIKPGDEDGATAIRDRIPDGAEALLCLDMPGD